MSDENGHGPTSFLNIYTIVHMQDAWSAADLSSVHTNGSTHAKLSSDVLRLPAVFEHGMPLPTLRNTIKDRLKLK